MIHGDDGEVAPAAAAEAGSGAPASPPVAGRGFCPSTGWWESNSAGGGTRRGQRPGEERCAGVVAHPVLGRANGPPVVARVAAQQRRKTRGDGRRSGKGGWRRSAASKR